MTIKAINTVNGISATGGIEREGYSHATGFYSWHMSGIQPMMHIPWESYPYMRSASMGGEVQRVDSWSCCGSSVKIVSKRSGESMRVESMDGDRR